MIIERKEEQNKVTFDKLTPGDVFEATDGHIYMKTCLLFKESFLAYKSINCVHVKFGFGDFCDPSAEVYKLDAKLVF